MQLDARSLQRLAPRHELALDGGPVRRMRARNGTKHAITATARKLAEIFYVMVTTGSSYQYMDRTEYDEKVRNWQIRNLQRRAAKLGYELKEKAA